MFAHNPSNSNGANEMNIYTRKAPTNGTRYGLGFKSKQQLPLIMLWKEWWWNGEVCDAQVLYSTRNLGVR